MQAAKRVGRRGPEDREPRAAELERALADVRDPLEERLKASRAALARVCSRRARNRRTTRAARNPSLCPQMRRAAQQRQLWAASPHAAASLAPHEAAIHARLRALPPAAAVMTDVTPLRPRALCPAALADDLSMCHCSSVSPSELASFSSFCAVGLTLSGFGCRSTSTRRCKRATGRTTHLAW